MKYKYQDGQLHDKPSIQDFCRSKRDNVILDLDDIVEVVRNHFAQQYGHEHPPKVKVTQSPAGIEFELEFSTEEYKTPFG